MAIINASKVDSEYNSGNYAAAQAASYEKVTVAGAPLSSERQSTLRNGNNDYSESYSGGSDSGYDVTPVGSSSENSGGSLGFEEIN